MIDVIIDFFQSEAVKNNLVVLIALLILSCALGCFVTAFILHKIYIPWKKKQIQDYKNKISELELEKEKLTKKFDYLNDNYKRLREHNQKCAVEADYEDYQYAHSDDAALSEFISD